MNKYSTKCGDEVGILMNLDYRYNFVPLQVGMKNVVMKCLSALVALWYCLSIIGFDVHSCAKTGEKFVVSTFVGGSCAEVHPEHACGTHGCHCGHHHDAEEHHGDDAIQKSQCCTNDLQVLSVTGITSSDNQRQYDGWSAADFICVVPDSYEIINSGLINALLRNRSLPDSGVVAPDAQALHMVWRI